MKSVVAVFAHPDDETTVSGTIAKMAQKRDVYIVCATSGDAGENHHHDKDSMLMFIREDELRASVRILGAKKAVFLGLRDGSLCNNQYHQIAARIESKLREFQPDTLITFEPRGISGHIDHIVITMATTYLFYRLPFVKTLMYVCMSDKQRKVIAETPEYFIYFPPGYKKSEVDKVIDISDVWEKKIESAKAHLSQKKDVETFILPSILRSPKEEYFIVLKKQSKEKSQAE